MESKKDLEEYVSGLLDVNNARHQRFIKELLTKWRPPERKIASPAPESVTIYNKANVEEVYVAPVKRQPQTLTQTVEKAKDGNLASDDDDIVQTSISQLVIDSQPKPDVRKKTKFVSLFGKDGEIATAAKIPGRHQCQCLAVKHKLINNCVRCGRIVCEQEGSGPCLFCGNLVCTKEENEILLRGSRKSDKLRAELMGIGNKIAEETDHSTYNRVSDGLEKAKKHKDKLLEFDKNSVKRTVVIDDESDYFASDSNKWLSARDRKKLQAREEELRALRHASRKDRKITLDFAGRRVVEEQTMVDQYDREDEVVQDVHYGKKREGGDRVFNAAGFDHTLVNPALQVTQQEPPQFVEPEDSVRRAQPAGAWSAAASHGRKTMRIQDRELQEMSDKGVCLSMHQPWASLLVRGIKEHEGRMWYTPHRGRLWIAATAKEPTDDEIASLQTEYTHMSGLQLNFPDHYPKSCLLGCVEVVDCLDAERYQEEHPDGESGSPYVFICENPQELLVKFPIKGQHKIYKLDSKLHQAAKKGLRPAAPVALATV